jgi:hypothetical protein
MTGQEREATEPIAAPSLFRACAALRLASNNPLQAPAALRPRSAQNTRWQAPHSVPPIVCSPQRSASPWPAESFLPTVDWLVSVAGGLILLHRPLLLLRIL